MAVGLKNDLVPPIRLPWQLPKGRYLGFLIRWTAVTMLVVVLQLLLPLFVFGVGALDEFGKYIGIAVLTSSIIPLWLIPLMVVRHIGGFDYKTSISYDDGWFQLRRLRRCERYPASSLTTIVDNGVSRWKFGHRMTIQFGSQSVVVGLLTLLERDRLMEEIRKCAA